MFENERRELLNLYDLGFHSLQSNVEILSKYDWTVNFEVIEILVNKKKKKE